MNKRKRYLYTAAICCCTMFLAIINASHGTLLSSLIDYYGLTDSQQGYPNAVENIGCIVAVVSSLLLIGRVDKRKIHIAGLLVLVITTALLSLRLSFPAFLAVFAVLGIGFGYVDVLNSSMVSDLYKGAHASQMMCLMHGCHGAAGILFPLILNAVLHRCTFWGGVYTFVCCIGICIVLYTVPVVFLMRKDYDREVVVREQPVDRQSIVRFFRTPILRILVLAIFFHAIYQMGIICWIKRYMEVGLGSTLGSITLSLYYLGMTASRFVVPLLKIKTVPYIKWSAAATAVLMALGIALGSPLLMCVFIALGSLLSGAMIPVIIAEVSQIYGGNTFLSSTMSFVFLMGGYTLSSPLIGMVESAVNINAGMLVCSAAVLCNGLVAFLLPREKKKISGAA